MRYTFARSIENEYGNGRHARKSSDLQDVCRDLWERSEHKSTLQKISRINNLSHILWIHFFSFSFNFILCLIFFFVLTFLIHRIGYLIYDILFAVSFPVSPSKKNIYTYINPFHTRFTFTLSVSFRSSFTLQTSSDFLFLSLFLSFFALVFSDLCLSRSKFRPRSRSISLDRSACCCSFVPSW